MAGPSCFPETEIARHRHHLTAIWPVRSIVLPFNPVARPHRLTLPGKLPIPAP